jgi:hypothetical protein
MGCPDPEDGFRGSDTTNRADEVDRWLEEHYFSRFTVQATTEGPMGETVDWVDPHELSPLYGQPAVPPSERARPLLTSDEIAAAADDSEDEPETDIPAGPNLSALWAAEYELAPDGTVPVIRPNFTLYVDGTIPAPSIEDYVRAIPQPQPAGQFRLYGAKIDTVANIGTTGWLQYFDFAQVPATGMSLGQLAVRCDGTNPATTMEAIEFGVQESPSQYGDASQHIFIYFRTAGGTQGNFVGGYNEDVAGFVRCDPAQFSFCTETPGQHPYPPGATVPNPGAGGAERRLRAQMGCVGTGCSTPAWWIQDYYSDSEFTWLGYYPIGTSQPLIDFDLIDAAACEADWYGEVFDPTPTTWDNSDMGNGVSGFVSGAGAIHGMVVHLTSGADAFFSTSASDGGPTDAACYRTSSVRVKNQLNWERWFRYGGPGGDAVGCD